MFTNARPIVPTLLINKTNLSLFNCFAPLSIIKWPYSCRSTSFLYFLCGSIDSCVYLFINTTLSSLLSITSIDRSRNIKMFPSDLNLFWRKTQEFIEEHKIPISQQGKINNVWQLIKDYQTCKEVGKPYA